MSAKVVSSARLEAARLLREIGIDDQFTVKVHPITVHSEAIAQYRSRSHFRSGPVFWISPLHSTDYDVVVDSILHEYGHVIWEYAEVRKLAEAKGLYAAVQAISPYGEEDFAETFAHAVRNGSSLPHLKAGTLYGALIK